MRHDLVSNRISQVDCEWISILLAQWHLIKSSKTCSSSDCMSVFLLSRFISTSSFRVEARRWILSFRLMNSLKNVSLVNGFSASFDPPLKCSTPSPEAPKDTGKPPRPTYSYRSAMNAARIQHPATPYSSGSLLFLPRKSSAGNNHPPPPPPSPPRLPVLPSPPLLADSAECTPPVTSSSVNWFHLYLFRFSSVSFARSVQLFENVFQVSLNYWYYYYYYYYSVYWWVSN